MAKNRQVTKSAVGKDKPPQLPAAQIGPKSNPRRAIFFLFAAVYMAWLFWLGFIAWVNIQSGNQ